MSILINIEDLLSGEIVEGARLELKAGWNPTSIMRSVCAFANDFENEGSGYIVVGVEEVDGKPVRPVIGFNEQTFEKVQRELISLCRLIQPNYNPRISLETIDGKKVLVIWVPAGSNRPYKVPDDVLAKQKVFNHRIRQYSSSVIPNKEQELELIQLTAQVPFDDQVNTQASIQDLNYSLMREHLAETNSKLYDESTAMSVEELADRMNLSEGSKEHLFPKNIGLLLFSDHIHNYFPFAKIEVVEFPNGLEGDSFKEKSFTGPIQKQLSDVLSYIKTSVIEKKVIKLSNEAKTKIIYNYPFDALEEAIPNAVYHRNYELREPIEIRILPEAIEIISYNGVDPSIKQIDFEKGRIRARRYRNRRIGEFLKELRLTEGKGTGIPRIIKTLQLNGSEKAEYVTDEPDRRHFIIEMPIHDEFKKQNSIKVLLTDWNRVAIQYVLEKELNLESTLVYYKMIVLNFIQRTSNELDNDLIRSIIEETSEVISQFFGERSKDSTFSIGQFINSLSAYYTDNSKRVPSTLSKTSEENAENFGEKQSKLRTKGGKATENFKLKAADKKVLTLMYLSNDKAMSAEMLSEYIGVSNRTIETYLAKLKEEGKIQREGSDKSGYWKLIITQ